MDPICHTLAGAAIGEAGLKYRTALGLSTLVIAANLPDVDVLVYATDTVPMAFRRGWTHGVLAMAILPPLLALAMLAWDRVVRQRRAHPPSPATLVGLLAVAYVGTLSHPFLDFLNSYGVRLLKPFSDRWFYGDALYIVDPWMYAVLGTGVVLARRAASRGRAHASRPARTALIVAGAYIGVMLLSNVWARSAVADGLARAGQDGARFMVTPVAVNPFVREVIVDTGERYEKGHLWFAPTPRFRPAGYAVDKGLREPASNRAMLTRRGQEFLRWSRFPFFVVDRNAPRPRVFLNDFRYSSRTGRDGWATVVIEP
ncbi:MAG: metal-dependent hydrolase [Vicinamibacterales bacterium]